VWRSCPTPAADGGAIDWAGVTDPTLRVLPEDPATIGVLRLPGETALATWVAHRCHRSLEPVFEELEQLSRGMLGQSAIWQTVGAAVVVTATQAPLLSGGGELVCMRRGQAVLDALTCFGLPVRGPRVPHARSVPVNTKACNQSSR
jgi:hypothetical protein